MSSIWKKLGTMIKGHATEAGQAIVDANATTILDQEIRDAENEINKARDARKGLIAKANLKKQTLEDLNAERARVLAGAKKAKAAGDEALATEAVERIMQIDELLTQEQSLHDQFQQQADAMGAQIKQAQSRIENLQFRVQSVKAQEASIAAQKAASSSAAMSGGKMATALDSLDRLEEQQKMRKAELEAAEIMENENSGKNLNDRLAALDGNKKSAADMLANLDNL